MKNKKSQTDQHPSAPSLRGRAGEGLLWGFGMEILDTLARNKSRSLLTGFGVFWGVFMLVGLIGGGQGLKEVLHQQMDGFATNSIVVWEQATTKAYHGFQKGREWNLTLTDVSRLRQHVPELDVVTPLVSRWGSTAVHDDRSATCVVKGAYPDLARVSTPSIAYGRYLNAMDLSQGRKVCVLGKKVYSTLFPHGGDPCGQLVRIDGIYFRVVGVNYAGGNININGSDEESVVLPFTVVQQVYNYGEKADIIFLTAREGTTASSLIGRIRRVISGTHDIAPDDEKAIEVFNTEAMYGMMDNLFRGVNLLVWLVGIGTLLAGAIGVSNIMLVTVRERTVEIGIRRAIGATPRGILTQIVSESVLLTSVAGMSGLLFAVLVLEMLEMAGTTDGVVTAHYQIGFWTAVGAVALLSVLGIVAGLMPALRAMSIRPVDAMRDE